MKPWLDDGDVRLYHGHTLAVLGALPDASVDCIVTSPPYYGLRDYGTATWEGGDAACDHVAGPARNDQQRETPGGRGGSFRGGDKLYRGMCARCGARRVDEQIGIEPTPAMFLDALVEVFREARRVLAPHGTCWVNLGDSYSTGSSGERTVGMNARLGRATGLGKQDHSGQAREAIAGLAPKNLLMMPSRLALALQDDGWILRREVIWAKPNPMPESATDRCTSAHEYVFHLTKRPRYYYDADAVREPQYDEPSPNGHPAGRNLRSVWSIATEPTRDAHFATYPRELVRRCLLAGCPEFVCRTCGKPRERITERGSVERADLPPGDPRRRPRRYDDGKNGAGVYAGAGQRYATSEHVGWSDCGHDNYRRGVVLDPFIGSGTTALVARHHGRHAIGIDLNADYLGIAARRLAQQSLIPFLDDQEGVA